MKERAEQRLAAMVEPALAQLIRLVEGEIRSKSPDDTRLAALKDVLDRTMGKAQQKVDVTTAGETIKAYVGVDLDRV